MSVITKKLRFKTNGNTDIIDITSDVRDVLKETNLKCGVITIFVPGATGAITTLEYEPGLIQDTKEIFEKMIPIKLKYFHNRSHLDGNAHSHLRASILGPSLTVPFVDGNLTLGTWQQIVFIDFDNRPRNREIILQIIGE
jgi:secondary thiamine-phosphate synthase enzyme